MIPNTEIALKICEAIATIKETFADDKKTANTLIDFVKQDIIRISQTGSLNDIRALMDSGVFKQIQKEQYNRDGVSIKNSHGSFQLVYRNKGVRTYFSPGLRSDPNHHSFCKYLSDVILDDLKANKYDESKEKYQDLVKQYKVDGR